MNLTKRAIWAVICLLATYGCSGNSGGEATGSTEEAVTYCGSPTLSDTNPGYSAVGSTGTPSSLPGTVSVVLPSTLSSAGGQPTYFYGEISLSVTGSISCAYKYTYSGGIYGSPTNMCTSAHGGTCPSVCPGYNGGAGGGALPANYQFTSVYNVTLSTVRQTSGVVYETIGATFQTAPLPTSTPCTSYTCSGGTVQTAFTPVGGTCPSNGNICDGVEACDGAGTCASNNPLPVNTPCSDGNVCDVAKCTSSHTCAPSTVYAPAGTPCDTDNNVCNGVNVCNGSGGCSTGTAPPAISSDGCITQTSCNAITGPVFTDSCSATTTPVALAGAAPTTIGEGTQWIYGTGGPQTGVAAGTIVVQQAAVIRGQVYSTTDNVNRSVKSGVTVSILGHPEYGSTLTRADGWFDMVVNGDGEYTVVFTDSTLADLPVQRHVRTRWNDYAFTSDVVMTAKDSTTPITKNSASYQVAMGGQKMDANGTRTALVLFPPATYATNLTEPSYTVSATEFTVNTLGPQAMPAELPPQSGYTYAVDLHINEADTDGVSKVTFNQPVYFYVDEFSSGWPPLSTGTAVPMGYYDRDLGAWETSVDASGNPLNGKVLNFTPSSGACDDGTSGCSDIPAAELSALAGVYSHSTSMKTLWRIPVMHFTAYDANWGFGVPSGTAGPPTTPPIGSPDLPASCKQPNGPGGTEHGSFIECLNQNVIESIPVADTPFTLNYASRRSQYSNDRISIPYVGGATLSPAPSHIDVTVEIAGQRHLWSTTTATANQSIVYNWDRKDAYGRLVQGSQFATVTVAYFYPGTVGTTVNFDDYPDASIGGSRVGREISITKTYQVLLGGVDGDLLGFGGWTLSPAHTLDLNSGLLDRGDGMLEEGKTSSLVNTVAGNHSGGTPTNGSSALAAYLTIGGSTGLQPLAYGHDGSLYVAGSVSGTFGVLYRVKPDGTIYIVGGNHTNSGSKTITGTSTPAVGAPISFGSIAVDTDDSIVVQDYGDNRIVRLSPMNPADCPAEPACSTSRTVSVIAGTGTAGFVDGLASVAEFSGTAAPLVIGPDRTIYLEDNPASIASPWVIRRLTTAGIVETLSGTSSPTGYPGATTLASLKMTQSSGLAVDSQGLLYIGYYGTSIYVLRADGTGALSTFAGGGSTYLDNGPAVGAELNGGGNTISLVFDSRDQLYIGDNSYCDIHLITGNGIIQRYAGTGTCAAPGAPPDNNVLPATTKLDGPGYLAMGPDDGVAFAGQLSGTVIRKVTGVGGPSFYRPSADGSEVYSFTNYEHTETKSALTGGGLYAFCYDSNWHLSKVIDEACSGSSPSCSTSYPNCTTSIAPSGSTVTITSRFGKVTTLSLTGGVTTSAAGPITMSDTAQRTYYLGYSGTQFDLLTTFADPNNYAAGKSHHLAFTADGLLTQDQDPIEYAASNAGTQLARTWGLYGWSTKVTTGAGRVRTLSVDGTPTTAAQNRAQERTSQLADGSTYVDDRNVDDSSTMTLPDGVTTIATSFRPDPRLGWSGKYVTAQTTNVAGLGSRTKQEYRTIPPGSDPTNPFSATSETDQIEINPSTISDPPTFDSGRYYQRSVNYSTNVVTYTSPVGRTVTKTFDSLGRVTKVQVPGIADVNVSYDTPLDRGVYQVTQAGRTRTNAFYSSGDPVGQLHTVSDSIEGSTSYDFYSNFDAPAQRTAPGLLVDYEGYDATGNLTAVRTPRSSSSTDTTYEHQFAPNDDNLLSLYTPPGSIGNTSYSYDFDRNLTQFIAPTSDTVNYGYDAAGRWSSRSGTSIASVTRGYDSAGRISTETAGGLTYTYGYTGQKLTSIKTSGLYAYSLSFGYDSYLRLGGWALASGGTPPTAPSCGASGICYDNDELLTSIGSMTAVSRSSTNGLLSGTTVNGFSDTYTYPTPNNYGELMEYDAGSSGSVYKETLTRDSTLGGRILSKTEVVNGGTPIVHNYTYDTANRLWTDGSATYTYDNDLPGDGNRTDLCATYDVQDRFGCGRATYTTDGRMTNDGTYTYTYDALGNLLTSSAAAGITYTVDSQNRRVKKVSTTPALTQMFLYGTGPYPLAQLDGSGNLQFTFYYGTGRNVPDYAVYNGTTNGTKINGHVYRLITDHLGSVRMVYDTSATSNQTVQIITYDAWGVPTASTGGVLQPLGFQPFGFAGGIQDPDTLLVRFGARDYNPRLGRWMTKDMSRFAGGLNFYAYANNDPVNFVDRSGRLSEWVARALGWLGDQIDTDNVAARARASSELNFGPTADTHNKAGDAYRHCVASCYAANDYGLLTSMYLGDANEVKGDLGGQPGQEEIMDLHNNACGLEFSSGSDTACESECMMGLSNGALQANVSDPTPVLPGSIQLLVNPPDTGGLGF